MKQATLCLLVKKNQDKREILLGMKKKGFGMGKWNGVGGKFEPEKDRTIIDTAIRETSEEIGTKIIDFEKVAVLDFYFPYVPSEEKWDMQVHVFLARNWEGEPIESEEMRPKWFNTEEVPFEEMWDDDKFWLPHILEGKRIKGKFVFQEGEKVAKKNLNFVEGFE